MATFITIGPGRMGRGIAVAFAYAGHRIAIVDLRRRPPEAWQRLCAEVRGEIRTHLDGLAQLDLLQQSQIAAIASRVDLVGVEDASAALAGAELVIEAVTETIEAKRDAFEQIGRHCGDDAILTSTTSSIMVTDLAAVVRRPERFLNVHWLNPAYLIPVVEVSTHAGTAPAVVNRTRQLLESIGKLTVLCGATPGYIVPRLQALIMNEAARMIEEGAATAEEIDKATRFGLGLRFASIGVLEFIDFGGADILHHASRELAATIDEHRYASPAIVSRMIEQGRLGVKSGSGFYEYAGRDLVAYRRDVLARILGMLRYAGLCRAPAAV